MTEIIATVLDVVFIMFFLGRVLLVASSGGRVGNGSCLSG